MIGESESANYITCAKGHKVYVIWSPRFKKFGFTCDVCNEHSEVAVSPMSGHIIKVTIVRQLKKNEILV